MCEASQRWKKNRIWLLPIKLYIVNIPWMLPIIFDVSWCHQGGSTHPICVQWLKVSKACRGSCRRCIQVQQAYWVGDIFQKRLPFRPHSISAIVVFTRVWAEDGIVISTTGCRKSTYWYIYMIATILLASAERSLHDSGTVPGTPRWRSFWHDFDHLRSKKILDLRNLWTRLVWI